MNLRGAVPQSRADRLALAYLAAGGAAAGIVGPGALSLGLPTALFVLLLTDGIARPGSSLLYPTVTHGPRDGRRVALSFDDGPDPVVTPAVLDALAQHGARATFFTIGRSLAAQPQLARRLLSEGHELGNHSWRHSRWQNFFGTRALTREIERGAQAIAAVDGRARPLYRPPLGLKSPPLARAASGQALTLVAWSLHSRDTLGADPGAVAARVLRRIRPGDIVLMHDGHDRPGRHRRACAAAVRLILQGLQEKSLRCVTVSELLQPAAAACASAAAPRGPQP
jgi:peptidoglycan/xylan/chitin deacetylase (PgdA/CDA1 family)